VHCSLSDNYVNRAVDINGLSGLEAEALQDIQSALHLPTIYGIPTEEILSIRQRMEMGDQEALFIKDPLTRGGFYLDAPQRVFVLSDMQWRSNPKLTRSPGLRGIHHYAPAVTLLHENGDNHNSWCRKTLIHETLHSVSLYSRIHSSFPNIVRLHESLIEGITECLIGYILLKSHPECYQGWKTSRLFRCSVSYRERVRLWCSLCQCVGVRSVAEFYLSQQAILPDAWNGLVSAVQAMGHTSFNYQLEAGKAFSEPHFRQVCVDSIPSFLHIYESLTRCLDFSQIVR